MKVITKLATMQTLLKQEVRLADRNVNTVNDLFTSLFEDHKDKLRQTKSYADMKNLRQNSDMLRVALRSMNESIRESRLRRKARAAKEAEKYQQYLARKQKELTAA